MNQQISSLIDQAANWIAKAQRILIGTGAGMSADSGIPTYRKAGELAWQRYGELEQWGLKAEDLSCPQAYEEDSARAWGFWERQRRMINAAQPHPGYQALLELCHGKDAFVQTTNVDGLHVRSGWDSARVHEMHGSLWRLQCCGEFWTEPRVPLLSISADRLESDQRPQCPRCGEAPRPHVLMFADLGYIGHPRAEAARREFHEQGVDVMITVGESGVISSHAHDAQKLKQRWPEMKLIDLNPDPKAKSSLIADIALPITAQEGLCGLAKTLNKLDN